MSEFGYRFDRFLLVPADRRLSRDGAPVEINARYLDALALLVREQGKLVSPAASATMKEISFRRGLPS